MKKNIIDSVGYSLIGLLLFSNNKIFAKQFTILDLQPNKEVNDKKIKLSNQNEATLKLINANNAINAWYVLELQIGNDIQRIHIENVNFKTTKLSLGSDSLLTLSLMQNGNLKTCPLEQDIFKIPKNIRDSYTEICDGQLLRRNKVDGRASSKEAVTSFLRKHVWGGEELTSMVKDVFYKDKFIVENDSNKSSNATHDTSKDPIKPPLAKIEKGLETKELSIKVIGIPIEHTNKESVTIGEWYNISNKSGMFLSAIEPESIAENILKSYSNKVGSLDSIERKAIAYSVAFDLDQYNLGFMLGTEHPGVEWADRVLDDIKKSQADGPDGIKDTSPLITTGKTPPYLAPIMAATFTGGFKRNHGAFKWGSLAKENKGSHYGFMEQGVIFSTLQPGLSTIYMDIDGKVGMKNWEDSDKTTILPKIVHARQNGVAIIEGIDNETKMPIPGKFVNQWGQGNWSGSAAGKQRSLRAGICLAQNDAGKTFLIYTYFSTISPNGMARVFQAYNCNYAMHLDMNALEHTYLATYDSEKDSFKTYNLISDMGVLDVKHEGKTSPRFVGTADNRDFFFVTRKK